MAPDRNPVVANEWRAMRRFALWALLGSVPFWIIGPLLGQVSGLPSALPMVAFVFVVPAAVAYGLSRREGSLERLRCETSVPAGAWGWWLVAACVVSGPILLEAWAHHGAWAAPSATAVIRLALAYAIAALGEEIGWTGYAYPRLLRLTDSPLRTALLLGVYWAVWHAVPFLQTDNDMAWVAAQSVQTMLTRCIVVGLCVASGQSVWLAVLAHAAGNLAWSLSPEGGARYDPLWVNMLLLPIAMVVLWVAQSRWRHRLPSAAA